MHRAPHLAVLDHQQDAEVAVDLDSAARTAGAGLRSSGVEERELRLARQRARAVEVLPALERQQRLIGEVVVGRAHVRAGRGTRAPPDGARCRAACTGSRSRRSRRATHPAGRRGGASSRTAPRSRPPRTPSHRGVRASPRSARAVSASSPPSPSRASSARSSRTTCRASARSERSLRRLGQSPSGSPCRRSAFVGPCVSSRKRDLRRRCSLAAPVRSTRTIQPFRTKATSTVFGAASERRRAPASRRPRAAPTTARGRRREAPRTRGRGRRARMRISGGSGSPIGAKCLQARRAIA